MTSELPPFSCSASKLKSFKSRWVKPNYSFSKLVDNCPRPLLQSHFLSSSLDLSFWKSKARIRPTTDALTLELDPMVLRPKVLVVAWVSVVLILTIFPDWPQHQGTFRNWKGCPAPVQHRSWDRGDLWRQESWDALPSVHGRKHENLRNPGKKTTYSLLGALRCLQWYLGAETRLSEITSKLDFLTIAELNSRFCHRLRCLPKTVLLPLNSQPSYFSFSRYQDFHSKFHPGWHLALRPPLLGHRAAIFW